MKSMELQKWLAQADDLTPFQRQHALNALAASDPDRASHDVIEGRIADERGWHCAQSHKYQGGGQSEGADFPNPERQCLREPAEGMDAKVQPSGDRVPGQLSGVGKVL